MRFRLRFAILLTAALASPSVASASFAHTVAPGESLTSVATADGLSVGDLAAANGLSVDSQLIAGSTLQIPPQGATTAAVSSPASTGGASSSATGGAQPTPETVSPAEVGSIASARGVSPSLAQAIADQESGFNNDKVSSTGAIGVMQIEPDTWNYIGSTLAGPPPLQPASAADNVRAGVLLIRSLVSATGGDAAQTAAAYFQGLDSVRRRGILPATQQYVQNVLALRAQFGGP
jgi:soluble lytic murein transglycosylase-like protein